MATAIEAVMKTRYEQQFAAQQKHIHELYFKLKQLDQKFHRLMPEPSTSGGHTKRSTIYIYACAYVHVFSCAHTRPGATPSQQSAPKSAVATGLLS